MIMEFSISGSRNIRELSSTSSLPSNPKTSPIQIPRKPSCSSLISISSSFPRRFSFGRSWKSSVSSSPSSSSSSSSSKESLTLESSPSLTKKYAEIPVLVSPLSPPREVVTLERIETLLTQEVKMDLFMSQIRAAQSVLKTASASTLKCNLVLGLHATSETLAGYCVNLKQSTCQIYTFSKKDLLLKGIPHGCAEKFSCLTNLIFAFLLWDKEIIAAKKVRIYIGNSESEMAPDEASLFNKMLHHFKNCGKVSFVNDHDFHVHFSKTKKEEDEESDHLTPPISPSLLHSFDYFSPMNEVQLQHVFGISSNEFEKLAKFIQPALDLTEGKGKIVRKHLENFYGLDTEAVFSTHFQKKWNKSENRYWMETTRAYDSFLEKVQHSIQRWTKACPKCGIKLGFDSLSGSGSILDG